MSEGISPAPVDGDDVVKPAQEPIQIPAENPPGDYSEVAERIMGELKALGVDRTETHEFVSGRPSFIIQAGEEARAIRAAIRYRRPHGHGWCLTESPYRSHWSAGSEEGLPGVVLTTTEKMYIIHFIY